MLVKKINSERYEIRTIHLIPNDWFVMVDKELQQLFKTKKSIRIEKLLELLPLEKIETNIKAVKKKRESNFVVFNPLIQIDADFVRVLAFVKGDGSFNEKRISAYNTVSEPLKAFTEFVSKLGCRDMIYVYVTVPASNAAIFGELQGKWSNALGIPRNRISVFERKNKLIRGKSFRSEKECVEVFCPSDTLAHIVGKIDDMAKELLPLSKEFQKAYLQGIFSAEGSVTWNKRTGYRAVNIGMKDEKEIERIAQLLYNFGVSYTKGISNGTSYITITNKRNLDKLNSLDIFELQPFRASKLRKLLGGYQRTQTISCRLEKRIFQIKQILEREASLPDEIAQLLDLSLNRSQEILKLGFDKGLWKRRRSHDSKSPYVYFI